jgi:large repetitive protein
VTFTVTATDSLSNTGNTAYVVNINAALAITTTSLPNWTVNTSGYARTVATSGGSGSLAFSISAGTLPTGLALNSTTGVISGTPSAAGAFSFTVKCVDAAGAQPTRTYGVTINAALAITTTRLGNLDVNLATTQTIATSGGTGTPTFALFSGTLPTGVTVSTAGVLSGMASVVGSYVFTLQATDSVGATATQSYTVPVYYWGTRQYVLVVSANAGVARLIFVRPG